MALKAGTDTSIFKAPRALLEHNANVLMVLVEIGLLGGLPIRLQDFSVAPLFGIVYIFFTWSMSESWVAKTKGPQFIYFFMDTTLGIKTSLFLLALLGVLSSYYGLFWLASYSICHGGGGVTVNTLMIALISSLVCKFSDGW